MEHGRTSLLEPHTKLFTVAVVISAIYADLTGAKTIEVC